MATLVIDYKSHVVVPTKKHRALWEKAALKTKPERALSIEEARALSKKPIRNWVSTK